MGGVSGFRHSGGQRKHPAALAPIPPRRLLGLVPLLVLWPGGAEAVHIAEIRAGDETLFFTALGRRGGRKATWRGASWGRRRRLIGLVLHGVGATAAAAASGAAASATVAVAFAPACFAAALLER